MQDKLQAFMLSQASLAFVKSESSIELFDWTMPPEEEMALRRITVADPTKPELVKPWARRCLDIGITPVLLLNDDESVPDLGPEDDLGFEWSEPVHVMVFGHALGEDHDANWASARLILSNPDAAYLAYWQSLMTCADRDLLQFPFGLEARQLDAYVKALTEWRKRTNAFDESWGHPPIRFQDGEEVDSPSAAWFWQLKGHPGVGWHAASPGELTGLLSEHIPGVREILQREQAARAETAIFLDRLQRKQSPELAVAAFDGGGDGPLHLKLKGRADRSGETWQLDLQVSDQTQSRVLHACLWIPQGVSVGQHQTIEIDFLCEGNSSTGTEPPQVTTELTVKVAQSGHEEALQPNEVDPMFWRFDLPVKPLIALPGFLVGISVRVSG